MTYDNELTLIDLDYSAGNTDDKGNQVPDITERNVLCAVKSAQRNEFYQAATAGLKPEKVFIVHAYEYEGEQSVRFADKEYTIVRTYRTGFEELELVAERRASNYEGLN